MINKFLVAGLTLLVLPVAALAADLPSKSMAPEFEPPPPIPVFSWTGLYAGVQAGYQFGSDRARAFAPGAGSTAFGYDPKGIIGGGHAGYNFATPYAIGGGALVVGLEGDIDAADYRRGAFDSLGDWASTRSDIKGSVRGRVGIAVNRVLFYATGGAAFADFNTRYDNTAIIGTSAIDTFRRSRVGYTTGGGIEYAFMNNWSARAEYRYSDYGSFSDPLVAAAPVAGTTVTHRVTDNRVQAGISYKFDSIVPASVVAKY